MQMRCEYKMQQFEEVLQKLCKSFNKYYSASGDDWEVSFTYDRTKLWSIAVIKKVPLGNGRSKWVRFVIYDAHYIDSPHNSKIKLFDKNDAPFVKDIIKELMKGISPEPPFSLFDYIRSKEDETHERQAVS